MRIESEERFWLVCDPEMGSEMADICFETCLSHLHFHCVEFLRKGKNITLYPQSEEDEFNAESRARADARNRLRLISNQLLDALKEIKRIMLGGEDYALINDVLNSVLGD